METETGKVNGYKSVVVRTRFEALHQWIGAAPTAPFLEHPHRHVFMVSTAIRVNHGNRAVEFFTCKNELDAIIKDLFFSVGPYPGVGLAGEGAPLGLPTIGLSCEDMAAAIANCLAMFKQYDVLSVSVSEDGENVGMFTFTS